VVIVIAVIRAFVVADYSLNDSAKIPGQVLFIKQAFLQAE
jgi:hypothetical protein